MSFLMKLYRRFVPKKLDHEQAQIAEVRNQLASQITDEQIYVETVRNAIKAEGASIADKLQFALMSLPPPDDFEKKKELFESILDYLILNDPDIERTEASELLQAARNVNRLEDLFLTIG